MSNRICVLLLVAVACLIGLPERAVSQSAAVAARHSERITVALVAQLPVGPEYAAAIIRLPSGRDVILLPEATANGELLDMATRTLIHARVTQEFSNGRFRGRSVRSVTVGVRLSVPPSEWAKEHLSGARAVVARLWDAPREEIPGVGRVRTVDFFPPSLQ
jgi:hypothetical protein